MPFNYVEKVTALTQERRLRFYEQLACNLTISIRAVWSDAELSDAERVDRMKWINEIMHRVTAKISITRLNTREWTDADMWEMIKGFVAQNNAIEGDVALAVLSSYQHVTQQTGGAPA
jgi:hypothetical protein